MLAIIELPKEGMMTEAGRLRFIRKLEDVADNIGDVPRHELQTLLRRAALRLRKPVGVPRDPEGEYRALIDEMNGDDSGAA